MVGHIFNLMLQDIEVQFILFSRVLIQLKNLIMRELMFSYKF